MSKKDVWLLILLILLTFFMRLPFKNVPLERDEGEYAYVAWQWQEGHLPYRDIVTSVTPGIFLIYEFCFKTFGDRISDIRLFTTFYVLLTLLLLYFLAKKLMGSLGAFMASVAFIYFATTPSMLSFASQREIFLLMPMAGIFWLLAKSRENKRLYYFTVIGFLSALIFMIKQTAIFNAVFVLIVLLWFYWRQKDHGLFWRRLACFVGGFISGLLPFFIYFYLKNCLEEFVFWNFSYPRIMNSFLPRGLKGIFFMLKNQASIKLAKYFYAELPLSFILILSLFISFKNRHKQTFLYWLWLVVLLAAVCAGWHLRPQYFQLLILPQSILIGWGLSHVWRKIKQSEILVLEIIFCIICFMVLSFPMLKMAKNYFFIAPQEISKKIYGPQAFFMAEPIADYVARNTTPQEQIYILGSEQEIYFYSKRQSASPYITAYALTYIFGQPLQRQQIVAESLKENPPAFILIMNNFSSLYDMPFVTKETLIFDEIWQLVHKQYVLDGFAVFEKNKNTLILGGDKVAGLLGNKVSASQDAENIRKKIGKYPDIVIYRKI